MEGIYAFGWTELYRPAFVKQPVPNCGLLRMRLLELTDTWWGLQLHCISGSNGWSLQWCPNPVLGKPQGVLCAPLPHCQHNTWLHRLPCTTLETPVWIAGQLLPQDTLESVSALICTTRFHWSDALMLCVGMTEDDLSTICLRKHRSEINDVKLYAWYILLVSYRKHHYLKF